MEPSTLLWSAQRVHGMLRNSRLPINEGWGHVAAQQSTCVVDAASRYLTEGTPPAAGPTWSRSPPKAPAGPGLLKTPR
ncbi:alpha/beta hydrolase [Sinosporangium siamense]|uniref:alpha/beta hydrolase n=1 Tax=Sinosporangium siamense TaxID=1367973 RepID=UPI0035E4C06A